MYRVAEFDVFESSTQRVAIIGLAFVACPVPEYQIILCCGKSGEANKGCQFEHPSGMKLVLTGLEVQGKLQHDPQSNFPQYGIIQNSMYRSSLNAVSWICYDPNVHAHDHARVLLPWPHLPQQHWRLTQ